MPAIWVGNWGWHLEGQVDYVTNTAWHSKGTKMPFNLLSLVLNLQYTCSASADTCGIPVQPWFTMPLCSRDPQGSTRLQPALLPTLSGHQLKKSQRQESTTIPGMAADAPPGPYREQERLYHQVSWAVSIIVHLTKSYTSNLRKKITQKSVCKKIAWYCS